MAGIMASSVLASSLIQSKAVPQACARPSGSRCTFRLKLIGRPSVLGARAGTMESLRSSAVASASSLSTGTQWEISVTSTAVLEGNDHAGEGLELVVLDKDSEARSEKFSLDAIPWDKKAKEGLLDKRVKSWSRKGSITLPAGIRSPGAVLLNKIKPADAKGEEGPRLDFISTIKLTSKDGTTVEIAANSWISSQHGNRVFFPASLTALPKDTPKPLAALRNEDMQSMRGTSKGPDDITDRKYGYQLYNDLARDGKPHPVVGGSKEVPFPRHIAIYKPDGKDPGELWVPLDEDYGYIKDLETGGNSLVSVTQALSVSLLEKLEGDGGFGDSFKNFQDTYDIFNKTPTVIDEGTVLKMEEERIMEFSAARDPSKAQTFKFAAKEAAGKLWNQLKQGKLPTYKFDTPRILAGRQEVLDTDEEYGRQFLNGVNPGNAIFALKQLPSAFGSAISPEHVDAELKALGSPGGLAQLVKDAAAGKKPRVFMVDYFHMAEHWSEPQADLQGTGGVEHAGRALLFLQQSEGKDVALIPLAIELKHQKTHELEKAAGRSLGPDAGIVYARQELAHDPKKKWVWKLAKAVFKSTDSEVHQLVSHFLHGHIVIGEPMPIALHRQLSVMHPLFKLLAPHFRYTINVNRTARKGLFNAGGLAETFFTRGRALIRKISVPAYRKWRFHLQAVPLDLKTRGLVDSQGKLWVDYPYGADGQDLWSELEQYYSQYLRLYYKTDADVEKDTELQAFWSEFKNEGHPDMKLIEPNEAKAWGFAGPIKTFDQLLKVITTIGWIVTGQHAAANYGAYDYCAPILNSSPMIRRPIFHPKDESNPAYQALVNSTGDKQEAEFLTYLVGPKPLLKALVVYKSLSIHPDDEITLEALNPLFTDPAAKALNAKFSERILDLEKRFRARNADPANWTRVKGRKESLEYKLLYPTTPTGLTSRGVPYSITI